VSEAYNTVPRGTVSCVSLWNTHIIPCITVCTRNMVDEHVYKMRKYDKIYISGGIKVKNAL
jgi:hypothetical protein